jgi:hypothetical protein
MLHQRLVFLYLFILFAGSFAQKYSRNNQNDDDDPDDEAEPQLNKKQQQQQPSLNNDRFQNRLPPGNINTNDGYPKPAPRQLPAQPLDASRQSLPTPIANSNECKVDVQKYCNKGSQQLLSNLKVLQCVDDLDNVRF